VEGNGCIGDNGTTLNDDAMRHDGVVGDKLHAGCTRFEMKRHAPSIASDRSRGQGAFGWVLALDVWALATS
jgi:hypothetical protein